MGSWPRTGSHILPVEMVQDTKERELDAVKFLPVKYVRELSVLKYRRGQEFSPMKMETLSQT